MEKGKLIFQPSKLVFYYIFNYADVITSTKKILLSVMFVCLFCVSFSVCLLAKLLKHLWMDCNEILWTG